MSSRIYMPMHTHSCTSGYNSGVTYIARDYDEYLKIKKQHELSGKEGASIVLFILWIFISFFLFICSIDDDSMFSLFFFIIITIIPVLLVCLWALKTVMS